MKALTLAEMQNFLQRRTDEADAVQQEITNCSEELHRYEPRAALKSESFLNLESTLCLV